MNDRIKQLRKDQCMTQVEFGNRIGVQGSTVTFYEKGTRSPSESVVRSICREFGVNRNWLDNGEGEMYVSKSESELPAELSNDPMIQAILGAYIDLDAQGRQTFQRFFVDVVQRYKNGEAIRQPSPAEQARARAGLSLDDIDVLDETKSS